MRSSVLMAMHESTDEDRVLLPCELPGFHGITLPSHVLEKLELREVMSLTGNSMHVVQIGSFIQYALATRSYNIEHTPRRASASCGTSTSAAKSSAGTSMGHAPGDVMGAATALSRRCSSSVSMLD